MLPDKSKATDEIIMCHIINTGVFDTKELMQITNISARAISRAWHRITQMEPGDHKKDVVSSYDALRCCVIANPPIRKTSRKRGRPLKKNKMLKDDNDNCNEDDHVLLVTPIIRL